MTEAVMKPGEGERLLAARRRKFWTVIGGILAVGLVAGFVSGFVAGYNKLDANFLASLPAALKFGAVGLLVAAFSYGCWRFVKVIDEVELADNLWASTVGFYVYSVLFPAWWALWKMGAAPEPNDWLIFAIALVGGGLAYLWRKWRAL
jgi:hypothetical protein